MINVYSTGGGFYTAETTTGGGYIALIEYPQPLCLTVYKNEKYTEENMVFSKGLDDLDTEENEIFNELFEALKNHLAEQGHNIKIKYDIENGYYLEDDK